MSAKVNLYDSAYANYRAEVYRQVRLETYGEDLGQTSWVSRKESDEIPRILELNPDSSVLELGCGSGGYAVHLTGKVGCSLVGLDINSPGVDNANQLAASRNLAGRARFQQCDISTCLPFGGCTFDAAFSNDVLCHIPGRANVLREIFRILKPGGRMLFSDALVIGGLLSSDELATRSSIGHYEFCPPGANERLIEQAGLQLISAIDTTWNAAEISGRWHDAREKRKAELAAFESNSNFEGLQRFLSCVHALTAERRLLRYLYVTAKPRNVTG